MRGSEIRNSEQELNQFQVRVGIAGIAVLVAFALLGARFLYLQVLQHDVYRAKAEDQGLEAAFLQMGSSEVELLASLREDSTIGKFLAKRGPGLHHVAYAVPDVTTALADAHAAGFELIDAMPRMGMHGAPIAFIHPKSVGGVLTEFVQA
jgi:methylmalonyl-CoA epimerase